MDWDKIGAPLVMRTPRGRLRLLGNACIGQRVRWFVGFGLLAIVARAEREYTLTAFSETAAVVADDSALADRSAEPVYYLAIPHQTHTPGDGSGGRPPGG